MGGFAELMRERVRVARAAVVAARETGDVYEVAVAEDELDDALRLALRRGEVDFIFGDAISLAFWINGTDSGECCAFSGGPFVESRYFGEGIGIAVRKGNDLLRQSLNWALFRLWEKGRYTDLWLRYFSISPF